MKRREYKVTLKCRHTVNSCLQKEFLLKFTKSLQFSSKETSCLLKPFVLHILVFPVKAIFTQQVSVPIVKVI